MSKKQGLNEGQYLAVVTERHLNAQRTRGSAAKTKWSTAFRAVPKTRWLMARVSGVGPCEAYNQWAAERVLALVTHSVPKPEPESAPVPLEFDDVVLNTRVTRMGER